MRTKEENKEEREKRKEIEREWERVGERGREERETQQALQAGFVISVLKDEKAFAGVHVWDGSWGNSRSGNST